MTAQAPAPNATDVSGAYHTGAQGRALSDAAHASSLDNLRRGFERAAARFAAAPDPVGRTEVERAAAALLACEFARLRAAAGEGSA